MSNKQEVKQYYKNIKTMAWIFKPIEDIKKEVFDELESTLSMRCKIGKYNQRLKEKVDWTLFVRYCIYQCDVYVDVFSIVVCTQHIYGEQLGEKEITDYVKKNIEKHQILTY